MGWQRNLLVFESAKIKPATVMKKLAPYQSKEFARKDGCVLVVYEGRGTEDFNPKHSCTIEIDGRNARYRITGNEYLLGTFNAYVDLCVGLQLSTADNKKLVKLSKTKKILKALGEFASPVEEDGIVSYRYDGSPDDAEDVMCLIQDLCEYCGEAGIDHRGTTFDDVGYGEVLGEMDDSGAWIGPSAYVNASWIDPEDVTATQELTLNDAETLIDGNSVPEWRD